MRKHQKLLCVVLTICTILAAIPTFSVIGAAESLSEDNKKMAKALLGYGYNITGGRELEKSSLIKSSRILDMNNAELLNHVYVSKIGKTTSENGVAYSAKELSEQIGSEYSGGMNGGGNICGIVSVNADISAKYDRTSNVKNIAEERYEYYLMKICNRQIGFTGFSLADYRKYLDPAFKADLESVKTEKAARAMLEKYGTHLFTGYELGGRMDITNYQSRSQTVSDWASDVSLSNQISVAVKMVNAGQSFSITEQYKSHADSSQLTSNYRCQTLGGKAVGSLTIDSLFTYSESMLDGKGHYIYENWINSINDDDGELLDIIGVPADGAAIPIWDLLPDDGTMNMTRLLLIQAYTDLCGDKYSEYMSKLPKLSLPQVAEDEHEHGSISITGCYMENGGIFNYCEANNDVKTVVSPGTYIYMTYDNYTSLSNFDEVTWTVSSSAVSVRDSINGCFRVNTSAKAGTTFTVSVFVNGGLKDTLIFTVQAKEFSGGTGTEENPYIISTVEDWKALTNSVYWGSDKHFVLANDIDLSSVAGPKGLNNYSPIGTHMTPFAGTFDGNYCTISGYSVTETEANGQNDIGLFGYNEGTIKNLKVRNPSVSVLLNRAPGKEAVNLTMNVGGLVGTNAGTVQNCIVTAPSISYQYDEKTTANVKGDTYSFRLGGLAGVNQDGTIEKSGVVNPCIKCDFDTANASFKRINIYTCIGGMTGRDENGSYQNCYQTVNTQSGTALVSHVHGKKQLIISETWAYQYVGGMIGYVASTVTLDNCVINYPDSSVQKGNCDMDTKKETYFGSLFGYNADDEKKVLRNVFAVAVSAKSMGGQDDNALNVSASRIDGAGNGSGYSNQSGTFRILSTDKVQFSNSNLSSAINSKNGWCADKNDGSPILKDFAFNTDALHVENALTDFSVRQVFCPDRSGEFSVILTNGYGEGEQIVLPCWHMNYSAYSGREADTCTVRVSTSAAFSESYKVSINQLKVVKTTAADISTGELFAGTNYDVTGRTISIKTAYSNGMIVTQIPLSYTLKTDSPLLHEGNNRIVMNVNGTECVYTVNAVERTVLAITMEHEPTNKQYRVGELFSTDGMVVNAYYSDNTCERVDNKDLEIIGGRIVEGQNDIIVSYGPYVTLSAPVNVEGVRGEDVTEPATERSSERENEPATEPSTERGSEAATERRPEGETQTDKPEAETGVEPTKKDRRAADVNGDNEITYEDAVLLLRYIHFPAHNPIKAGTGDVDGDGFITSDDAIYLNHYLFAPGSYPIGD